MTSRVGLPLKILLLLLLLPLGLILPGCPSEGDDSPAATSEVEEAAPDVTIEWVDIPAGNFILGTDDQDPDEGPAGPHSIEAFRLSRYEITNQQYQAFLKAIEAAGSSEAWDHPDQPAGKSHEPGVPDESMPDDYFTSDTYADHPVVLIDWYDAYAFCKWAGGRLPTEFEWERAARGLKGRTFPWGNDKPTDEPPFPCNYLNGEKRGQEASDGFPFTAPIGSFEKDRSPTACMDMAANVAEWTSSPYLPYDPDRDYPIEFEKEKRVVRGGSWDSTPYLLRLPNRIALDPLERKSRVGFRIAK